MNIKGSKLCVKLALLLFASLAMVRPALAADNVTLQWSQTHLQAIRNTRTAPMIAARSLAIMHTAMFDAWAAYDTVAVGTRLGGSLRRPVGEHTQANKEKAISFAAYRTLVDLYPTQVALFDSQMASLGFNPQDTSTDTTTPTGVGNVAAAEVIAFRHHDGSNQLGDLSPGAYSDYTMYMPVNGPDKLRDPNRWQPLRAANGQVQTFLTPHWQFVTPFAFTSGSELRPPSPKLFPGAGYTAQARDLVDFSAKLTDREKSIAVYWADGPATETPPGHWQLFGQFVSRRDGHTLDQDVKMFFALANAVMDASILCWESKRFYDYVRPISAIRFLFAGRRILAWGGPFQGTRIIDGATWQPYIPTPPFAEYTSGHSTFSSASAEVLKSFTGSDFFGNSATIAAGSSFVEPGAVPATDVTLAWATFTEAAEEAGISRRYGGIHFEDGDLQARIMGRQIGARVWEKAQTYFNGTAGQ
jgi:hypothetical protein